VKRATHRCRLLATLILSCSSCLAQGVTLVKAFPNLSFTQPILLTHAGDGTNRIFVVQQTGQIYVFPNDSAVASANLFLDIQSKLSALGAEEGLVGLAFHPSYAANGYFYVNYTAPNPLRTVVARYRVLPGNPNKADTASAFTIVQINQPYTNHNGGNLAFGPDGYLYIGMGDGGSGNDPDTNAQNRSRLLGKILRIDVNDTTASTHYRIPPDNPYAGNALGWRQEIWAYGFRNPWRWSFDPSTGALWVGDVGQGAWEEVDIVIKGGNYGWNIMEGNVCRPPTTGCDTNGLVRPIKVYDHSGGKNAITGGYVYHGYRRPNLAGAYIYADYGTGLMWMLRYVGGELTADSLLIDAPMAISSFGLDQNQELYICSYVEAQTSAIYRFTGNPLQTSVDEPAGIPAAFRLEQNYPNPFNPSTTISFALPLAGHVRLEVFDILGRKVASLIDENRPQGHSAVTWNARESSSGVYFYRLSWPGGVASRAMILAK
jgi:glucose/arabinose dehydrogenase